MTGDLTDCEDDAKENGEELVLEIVSKDDDIEKDNGHYTPN